MKEPMEEHDVFRILQRLSALEKFRDGFMIQSGHYKITERWQKGGWRDVITERWQKAGWRDVKTTERWPKAGWRDVKTHEKKILFQKPFLEKPKIHLGITHLDTGSVAHDRSGAEVSAAEVSKKGFTIKVNAMWYSVVLGFAVDWLAYTCLEND